MARTLFLILLVVGLAHAALIGRARRQTFVYDEELKQIAQVHPGTKIIVGHAGRYAPQDWPSWYTRTMMQWDGLTRMGPFQKGDARYVPYHQGKAWNKIA